MYRVVIVPERRTTEETPEAIERRADRLEDALLRAAEGVQEMGRFDRGYSGAAEARIYRSLDEGEIPFLKFRRVDDVGSPLVCCLMEE